MFMLVRKLRHSSHPGIIAKKKSSMLWKVHSVAFPAYHNTCVKFSLNSENILFHNTHTQHKCNEILTSLLMFLGGYPVQTYPKSEFLHHHHWITAQIKADDDYPEIFFILQNIILVCVCNWLCMYLPRT